MDLSVTPDLSLRHLRWLPSATNRAAGVDKSASAGDFKAVISNPHMRVFQNGSLAVMDVDKSDAGSYLCQVANGIGSGLSKVVTLSVNGTSLTPRLPVFAPSIASAFCLSLTLSDSPPSISFSQSAASRCG